MIYNRIIWCHPEEDGFQFVSGTAQGFFLMSSQNLFFVIVVSGINLHPDLCKAALWQ